MYQKELSKILFVKNIFENGMIPKLNHNNGPPKCGIYTMGRLSKLHVLIGLEETNKNRSQIIFLTVLFDTFLHIVQV